MTVRELRDKLENSWVVCITEHLANNITQMHSYIDLDDPNCPYLDNEIIDGGLAFWTDSQGQICLDIDVYKATPAPTPPNPNGWVYPNIAWEIQNS